MDQRRPSMAGRTYDTVMHRERDGLDGTEGGNYGVLHIGRSLTGERLNSPEADEEREWPKLTFSLVSHSPSRLHALVGGVVTSRLTTWSGSRPL